MSRAHRDVRCPVCGVRKFHASGCPYPNSTFGAFDRFQEAVADLWRTVKARDVDAAASDGAGGKGRNLNGRG